MPSNENDATDDRVSRLTDTGALLRDQHASYLDRLAQVVRGAPSPGVVEVCVARLAARKTDGWESDDDQDRRDLTRALLTVSIDLELIKPGAHGTGTDPSGTKLPAQVVVLGRMVQALHRLENLDVHEIAELLDISARSATALLEPFRV